MAPQVFGQRFVGREFPAWHAMGTTRPKDWQGTVEDAIREANIDYRYFESPIGYTLPNGAFAESGKRKMVLREPVSDDPTWRELGIVSTGYQFLQNIDLARGIDTLSEATGWQFETVGALGFGGIVFMTLKIGKTAVFGDEYDMYLVVSDGKASGRALTLSIAMVRVVCANTLHASDKAASFLVKVPHNANVGQEYGFWLDHIEALSKAQEETVKTLERFADQKIENDTAARLIASVFPMPAKNAKARQAEALRAMPELQVSAQTLMLDRLSDGEASYESAVRLAVARREATYDLYSRFNVGQEQGRKFGPRMSDATLAKVSNTPYAVLQAAVELVDFGGSMNAEDAAASAMFGTGRLTKARAWETVAEFCEVK